MSASLGTIRSQQLDEQSELVNQLTPIQADLEQELTRTESLSLRQAELEKQLSQATSQFEKVKAVFSEPVGSIAVNSILFDIAKVYGLEVTEVTSPGPANDILEGVTCSVLPLTAEVQGDIPNLVNLITELNNSLETGVIESITITIPGTTSGDDISASIRMVVYFYQGD